MEATKARAAAEGHGSASAEALERVEAGAQAHGFLNDLDAAAVAQVLERECGVSVHPSHLWRVLTDLGWSCQRPGGKAAERDEEAIACWKRYTWPALKKALNEHRTVVFVDESGLSESRP